MVEMRYLFGVGELRVTKSKGGVTSSKMAVASATMDTAAEGKLSGSNYLFHRNLQFNSLSVDTPRCGPAPLTPTVGVWRGTVSKLGVVTPQVVQPVDSGRLDATREIGRPASCQGRRSEPACDDDGNSS